VLAVKLGYARVSTAKQDLDRQVRRKTSRGYSMALAAGQGKHRRRASAAAFTYSLPSPGKP